MRKVFYEMASLNLNIEKAIADGRITSDEVKGLTQQEQETLSQLINKDVSTIEDGDVLELGDECNELVQKADDTLAKAIKLERKRRKQLDRLTIVDGISGIGQIFAISSLLISPITGIASGIAAIAKKTESAKGLGALSLAALTVGLGSGLIGGIISRISKSRDDRIAKRMDMLTINSLNPHGYDMTRYER